VTDIKILLRALNEFVIDPADDEMEEEYDTEFVIVIKKFVTDIIES